MNQSRRAEITALLIRSRQGWCETSWLLRVLRGTCVFDLLSPELYGGTNRESGMSDDLDKIVTRYAETELTLEEAVERADVDRQAFIRVLKERDIEIRPYPIIRDTDEIIAYLAREMVIPLKTPDGCLDEYGLSKKGHPTSSVPAI